MQKIKANAYKMYNIKRIRIIKKNGSFEVFKTMTVDLHVTDIEKYREKVKHDHGCTNVNFHYVKIES